MVKISITLLKYMPQAYFNYQRQSTQGWTIGTVLFDFLGGAFSLTQILVNAWDHGMIFSISHYQIKRNQSRGKSRLELWVTTFLLD